MQNLSKSQIITLVLFIIALITIPFLIIAVQIAQDPRTGANPDIQPQEVLFSNITSNSFTLSYVTNEPVQAFGSASSGGSFSPGQDPRDTDGDSKGNYKAHYLVFRNLQPDTEYTVTINSGGESFEDAAWKIKTIPLQDSIGTPLPLRGIIEGGPYEEALVLAMAGDNSGNTSLISVLIENNSTFVLDKNNLNKPDGTPLKSNEMDSKDILLYVVAPGQGKAKIQFNAKESKSDNIILSSEPITFSPTETITPGSDPTLNDPDSGGSDSDSDTDTLPEDEYFLDSFNESLLKEMYSSGAEEINPYTPYDIYISNIGPTGFTVNWRTKQLATGYIEVIESGQANKVVDKRDGSIDNAKLRFTHSVEANSGSIPAGTVFEFQIVSNEIRFGKNLDEIAEDYNSQFRAYVGDDTANTGANAGTIGTPVPANPDTSSAAADSGDFVYEKSSSVTIEPFKVVVPEAPANPPLPVALQGNITSLIDSAQYEQDLNTTLVKSGQIELADVDTERDFIIAAKTSDSLWASSYVNASGGYSISLGSSVISEKDAYLEISDGDSLTVTSAGYLNQETTSSESYSQDPVSIEVADPKAFLSVMHGNTVGQTVLFGYTDGSTVSLGVNEIEEQAQASNNRWQLQSQNLEVGLNEVDFDSDTKVLFKIDLNELPVTSLDSETILIIIGLMIVLMGIVLYYKYAKKDEAL